MSMLIAPAILPAGRLAMHYGTEMIKGVDPKQFARLAPGEGGKRVKSNHPAWVYGHLSNYPGRALELLGHPDAKKHVDERYQALFKNGTECLDDPEGTIYPPMQEIMKRWESGYKALFAILEQTPDEVYQRENPAEGRFKEVMPTLGAVAGFIAGAHQMSHLGQVSAWRRFMGLPPAM